MLEDAVKQQIRDFYTSVSDTVPGFKPRGGQRKMIGSIASTMGNANTKNNPVDDGSNIIVVEGKTGVGKTVGYLVPAIVLARSLGKKLVVSSATVALQEQLVNRDIPSVLSAYHEQVKVVLAKGRGRFVCEMRLIRLAGGAQEELFGDAAAWDRPPKDGEINLLATLHENLGSGKWNGDKDSLEHNIADDLWSKITNDSNGCVGRRCRQFSACAYFKARQALDDGDLIVANHDLVLSALSSDSTLLPSPDESIFVFDEAHHLPSVAVSRFSAKHALHGAAQWLERIPPLIQRTTSALGQNACFRMLSSNAHDLAERLNEMYGAMKHSAAFADDKKTLRFAHGTLPANLMSTAENIQSLSTNLVECFGAVKDALETSRKENEHLAPMIDSISSEMGLFNGRSQNLKKVWDLMLVALVDGMPCAKWIESDGRDFHVCASPISAASILYEHLWKRASGVVLTSATITTLGSFDFFLRNSGLSKLDAVNTLSVQSPFDFENQGEIFVPSMNTDPTDAQGHTSEIAGILPGLLEGYSGSLVLFASRAQMKKVYELIPVNVREKVLMQGDMTRKQILSEHSERVTNGNPSTIFGMASFGEGVDLPGKLCDQVIIAKIPFAPPDTPLEQAMAEWIEKNGGKPFFEISLPKAGLNLVQWIGRLLRTEDDYGRIVFLDTRIIKKSYGKMLINGFPPMPLRCHEPHG